MALSELTNLEQIDQILSEPQPCAYQVADTGMRPANPNRGPFLALVGLQERHSPIDPIAGYLFYQRYMLWYPPGKFLGLS